MLMLISNTIIIIYYYYNMYLLNYRTLFLFIITLIIGSYSTNLQNNIVESQNLIHNNNSSSNNRQLQQEINSTFFIQPSILTFLKTYNTRSYFCWYQCQNINIFTQITCYLNYKCYSKAIFDITIILALFLYLLFPITLILLGVWTPRCFGRYLATFTGLKLCYLIFQQCEKKVEDDAITNSQNTSQQSGNSGLTQQNQNKKPEQ